MNHSISKLMAATIIAGSSIYASAQNNVDAKYSTWPTYDGNDLEMVVDNHSTRFTLRVTKG